MASAKNVLVNYELEDKQEKNVKVPRSAAEIQRFKLEKLLKKAVSHYASPFLAFPNLLIAMRQGV